MNEDEGEREGGRGKDRAKVGFSESISNLFKKSTYLKDTGRSEMSGLSFQSDKPSDLNPQPCPAPVLHPPQPALSDFHQSIDPGSDQYTFRLHSTSTPFPG